MESEEMIAQQKKHPFQFSYSSKKPDLVNAEREESGIFYDGNNERLYSRERKNLFGRFSREKNISIQEKRFRLKIFDVFIEHFCMSHRVPLKDFISNIEQTVIIRVLSQFDGNQKKAAEFLGLKPTTLHEKIKKYNIYFQKCAY